MKKQKMTSTFLKFSKVNIANLHQTNGGADGQNTNELSCYSKNPECHTVPTRPDSLADG
ncbi:hypothetical protein [Kordia sp.]|uniref:hypothetical protein n=1 Tax=Kordia sp. TaxID=1965332 RepID=UPI003B5A162C